MLTQSIFLRQFLTRFDPTAGTRLPAAFSGLYGPIPSSRFAQHGQAILLGLPAQSRALTAGLTIALATFVGTDLAELGAGHARFPPVIALPRQEPREQDTDIGAIAGNAEGFCILADVRLFEAGMLALLTGAGACQACIDTGLLQFDGHLLGPLPKITCSGMVIRLQTLQKNNTPSMQSAPFVRMFARNGPQPAVKLPIISDCDKLTARVFRHIRNFPMK